MKVCFIVNPAAGTHKHHSLMELIHEGMQPSGCEFEIILTSSPGSAGELAKKAVHEKSDIVVACGGDGTVSEVAEAVTGTSSALAILPRGSGNGLARHHGIPLDIPEAIQVILKQKRIPHDVILINGRSSVNVSGIGFDAHVASLFGKDGKRGLQGYAKLVISEFFRYREQQVTITFGESETSVNAFLIAIANSSQFGNNAFIAPMADTGDGLTDLTVVKKMSVFNMPLFAYRVFNKSVYRSPFASRYCNNRFTITSAIPLPLHIDGEPAGHFTRFDIETKQHAFQLIVP